MNKSKTTFDKLVDATNEDVLDNIILDDLSHIDYDTFDRRNSEIFAKQLTIYSEAINSDKSHHRTMKCVHAITVPTFIIASLTINTFIDYRVGLYSIFAMNVLSSLIFGMHYWFYVQKATKITRDNFRNYLQLLKHK